jgi:vancomycin resistance protein YoaR
VGETGNTTARRPLVIGGIALASVVGLVVLLFAGLWFFQRGEVLPNTSIAGVDVGGMSEDEVRSAIAPTVEARESDPVTFRFEETDYTVTPDELGYSIDVEATVQSALGRGRDASIFGDARERLASLRGRELALPLLEQFDPDAVVQWVAATADEVDRPRFDGDVRVDEDDLQVIIEPSVGSATVLRDETEMALVDALLGEGPDELDLPVEASPQPISDAELNRVASQLERALAAPLVLSANDETLTLEPRDLAQLIEVERTAADDRVTMDLVVLPERVDEELGELASGRFDRSPRNASFSASRTPPRTFDTQGSTTFTPVGASVEVEPGRTGLSFDPELAAEQLTELVREGDREAEFRLEEVEPELSTERAEELAPTHLIGTFTTYYTAGQARNTNIQRLADVIDGAVVLPGEQFSINEISGPRSCDKGYVPAGTIVAGELVDTCGGGTSQFGTTTFNAAFFSGVQLDQWKAHSWYISRYPMGREATLTYPTLDVKFTNATAGVILVKTSHTATSVTVSLYGQPIAEAVSARHGSPTNQRSFSTEVRNTSSLRQGQERVLQGGAGGFTVEVVRTIELIDGGTESQTIRTVYVPQTRIIERGTASAPAPAAPDPEPDPEPEPEPEPEEDGNGD